MKKGFAMNIYKVLAVFVFVLLAGCVMNPRFEPETLEGAECKLHCAESMSQCRASTYTCELGYASCLQACKDIEAVSK